ncbi:MAG TPA: TrmH family RNA methyltransferase [Candidatus Saccharimonadia bacterium]|nr:TrmH family RNA methyltransferase [Candidatus Saccharimonadia bacterium]
MNGFRLHLILDNLRSAGNVGSILRTADATAVEQVYACGTTPYPATVTDSRPPHVISSNQRAVAKTALGAENTIPVKYVRHLITALDEARSNGFKIIVVEQSEASLNLFRFNPPKGPLALVLGNEVTGVSEIYTHYADAVIELPMLGQKESLNVAVAAAIVLYQLRFRN